MLVAELLLVVLGWLIAAAEDSRAESSRGKVVVITGASSGFGKGAARAFAKEGADVVLAARRGELLDELAAECNALGGRAIAAVTDVSQPTEVEALAETALKAFGAIDVWVNNAGVAALGSFEEIPLADHEKVIEIGLLGTLYGSYCAYRVFRRQGEGTLINITSELKGASAASRSSYAAAKYGVVGLSDSLRREVKEARLKDIHVCTVMPRAHDTPFFDHAANYTGREIQAPEQLHDPGNVVDTIVRLAKNPKDGQVVVGDGIGKFLRKKLTPETQDSLDRKMVLAVRKARARSGESSPNSLHAPMPGDSDDEDVSGGRR